MRLLNVRTLKLESFINPSDVKYAILSHTWGEEEVLYEDFQQPQKIHYNFGLRPTWSGKIAAAKVTSSCARALKDGFDYIWIDTCCIDKSSSAELSEAINSMFQWYRQATRCYAYLEDVDLAGDDTRGPDGGCGWKKTVLAGSRWFTRGWTLQELIAPPALELYDCCWKSIGTRDEMALQEITGIPRVILHSRGWDAQSLGCVSAACKMSWAANRETTRPEDEAYCLMGLFNVNMPLLYGEGRKAFLRLQEEIIRTTSDQSILAHNRPDKKAIGGILADEPSQFVNNLAKSRDISLQAWAYVAGELSLDVWLVNVDFKRQAAILDCTYFACDRVLDAGSADLSSLGKVEGEQLSWPVIIISKMPGAQSKYIRSDSKLRKIVADDWGEVVLVTYWTPRPSRYLPFNRFCERLGGELINLDGYGECKSIFLRIHDERISANLGVDCAEPKINMTAARRQRITLVSSPDSYFGGTLQRNTALEVREIELPNSLELRSKVSFDYISGSGSGNGGTYTTMAHNLIGVTGFWVQTRTNPITIIQERGRITTMPWFNWDISRTLKFFVLWELCWYFELPLRVESDRTGRAVKILRPDEFFDGEDEAGPDPWSTVIERLSGGPGCAETVGFVESCLKSRNGSVEDKIEIGGLWTSAKFSQVSVLNRRFPRLDIKVE